MDTVTKSEPYTQGDCGLALGAMITYNHFVYTRGQNCNVSNQ